MWGREDAFLTPDYPMMLARMVQRGNLHVMDTCPITSRRSAPSPTTRSSTASWPQPSTAEPASPFPTGETHAQAARPRPVRLVLAALGFASKRIALHQAVLPEVTTKINTRVTRINQP